METDLLDIQGWQPKIDESDFWSMIGHIAGALQINEINVSKIVNEMPGRSDAEGYRVLR